MTHEEICTYEVAKLAKEKGFDVPTAKNYRHKNGTTCNAPSQSQLQKWLREEKGVIVEVIAQPTCSTSKKNCYWWSIKQNSDGFCYQYEECSYILYSDEGYFDTYEQALEDALAYSLKN